MNDKIKKPLYILSAIPSDVIKINSFFSADEKSVKYFLEHPNNLRQMGWDLQTLSQAKLIKGEYFEILNGERKKIHLYENGSLILAVDANQNFLGWGREKSEFIDKPRLNPVALIEVTYNYIDFYRTLISFFDKTPEKIKFIVRLINTKFENGNRLYLNPYGIGTIEWMFDNEQYFASEEYMEKEIIYNTAELLKRPEHCTYLIIEKIYSWFSMTTDKIPLLKKVDKSSVIDIEKIKKL